MLVNINGRFVPHEDAQLPITDGSFLFGDSLFETLKGQGKQILLQQEHLDRLELSARLLAFPCDRPRIETALQQLARALSADVSRIRLTLSRGSHQGLDFPDAEHGWFLLTAVPYQPLSNQQRDTGAICVTAPNRRVNPLSHLPQMKRGNYTDCLYAANYARSQGAREALFADSDGNLLEGATSNLFAISDGRLLTPPTGTEILAGIMRRQLIDTAAELGIPVTEGKLTRQQLFSAEEAFLCNSLIDILPLAALDGRPLRRGTVWKELLKTLRVRIGT